MNRYRDYLEHAGVKGMRWGVRKAISNAVNNARQRSENKRNEFSRLSKAKGVTRSDRARFAFGSQPLHKKVIGTASHQLKSAIVAAIINKMTSNKSSKQVAIDALKLAAKSTLRDVIIRSALAKLAKNKYDSKGKPIRNKKLVGKYSKMTREDKLELFSKIAIRMAPIAGRLSTIYIKSGAAKVRQRRENFERWGANILDSKTGFANDYTDPNNPEVSVQF